MPALKNRSPSTLRRKLRLDGVAGVDDADPDCARDQENVALWNPIAVKSAPGAVNSTARSSFWDFSTWRSRSSV